MVVEQMADSAAHTRFGNRLCPVIFCGITEQKGQQMVNPSHATPAGMSSVCYWSQYLADVSCSLDPKKHGM